MSPLSSGTCRLTTGDDSETTLEADIARHGSLKQQREVSQREELRGVQTASGASVDVIQLQCVVEAKDRDLANMQERIAALQVGFYNS